MRTRSTLAALVGGAALVAACAKGEKAADTAATVTPAGTPTAAMPPMSPVQMMQGKWNMRSVPATGSDTTPTLAMIDAGADSTKWTINLKDRPPIAMHIVASGGDSVVLQSDEYESVRRKGVRVTTTSVIHVQGDKYTGTTTAHYKSKGADTVLVLKSEATKAP